MISSLGKAHRLGRRRKSASFSTLAGGFAVSATLNLGQSFALSIAAAISLRAAPVDAALAALAAVALARAVMAASALARR
jgi:hypothetical protein